MSSSRISELSSIIASNTANIDAYLSTRGIPSPSFDVGSDLPDETAKWRQEILEATDELHSLMLGPVGILTQSSHNFLISLQAISRFNIANSFPAGKNQATFSEIAAKSNLTEDQVQRIIRYAATYRVFSEPSKGVVAHTGASKLLEQSPLMQGYIDILMEDMMPAAIKTVDAMAKWPGSEEPNHAGFNLAHNTNDTLFKEFSKTPAREERYSTTMSWLGTTPGLELSHVVNGFAWSDLPENAVVVDVGGGLGALSTAIATEFPSLQFVVQDHEENALRGAAQLPGDLKSRVKFMQHDFFTEQPVKDADVYLLRWILHDWSDKYAAKILQGLIPALKAGARIVIVEFILPEPGAVSTYQERALRNSDFNMMEFHNAKERDIGAWIALFRDASPRFKFLRGETPAGSKLGIVEFICDGPK